MTELDDFLTTFLPRQINADTALHDGDVAPRMQLWSIADPVTVCGAFGPCKSGWAEVSQTFRWIAARFSNSMSFDFELVAAGTSGDLAYTVGYERSTRSLDGGPAEPATLRVTHVYRRENGEWKIVHRHADQVLADQNGSPADSRPETAAAAAEIGSGGLR
jgi:ketosteroid isomerase-like protein